ncbi:MAG: hypothetical protein M3015_13920 [Bacteroidota bacterium]|nr:hypothetical protein [Bacteroidota bacterium]
MIVFFLLAFISCNGSSQQKKTPKEFINEVNVGKAIYSRDSTTIVANLYQKMKNHEASFTNPEYYDSTVLIIDTIIYDPSLNKIAVFVIAKNPTYRNPHSDSKLPFYYNANCYLGKRMQVDSTVFELKQLGPFSLVNFDDTQEIRQAIRDYYFLELATVLDEKSQPVFNYNIDDKRFWDSPTGWKRMFE